MNQTVTDAQVALPSDIKAGGVIVTITAAGFIAGLVGLVMLSNVHLGSNTPGDDLICRVDPEITEFVVQTATSEFALPVVCDRAGEVREVGPGNGGKGL